jgi:hypothetical protein
MESYDFIDALGKEVETGFCARPTMFLAELSSNRFYTLIECNCPVLQIPDIP